MLNKRSLKTETEGSQTVQQEECSQERGVEPGEPHSSLPQDKHEAASLPISVFRGWQIRRKVLRVMWGFLLIDSCGEEIGGRERTRFQKPGFINCVYSGKQPGPRNRRDRRDRGVRMNTSAVHVGEF